MTSSPEDNSAVRVVDLIVTGAEKILTCAGGATDLIGCTTGGVAIDAGVIVEVGDVSAFAARRTVDATGRVVMPGFVDAHTHVVFSGTRVQEYAARVAGVKPPDGAPVGILGTMAQTRTATADQLTDQAAARVMEMIEHGTTTLESKSGYGLEPDAELRLLQANRQLAHRLPIDVASTYLGAHAFPPGVGHANYVDQVVELIPQVVDLGLADFCDVYCDEGYFDLVSTRRILETGRLYGLKPKLHLDAYSHTGAAGLAVELAAVSVDHLNFTKDSELEELGSADVAGVYMPCLDFAVRHPRPLNPRRLVEAGMEIALATDICPGSWTTSMQLAIQMACRTGGLSVPQALRAATYGAAMALGRADRVGSLEIGMQADVIVLNVPCHEDIAYRLGRNSVSTVIRHGVIVKEQNQ